MIWKIITVAAAAVVPNAACAEIIDEARIGAAAHALDLNGGPPAVESGVNVSGEILFASPDFSKYILSPRPYVHGSLNTKGDTNFYGLGLAWEQHFLGDRFVGEIDFGVARHDGVVNPPPEGDPARDDILATRALLGSRYLFRVAIGAGVKLDDHWRAQLFYEHLSNGRVLGDSPHNQGLDNLGIRIGYRFGD